jgi:oxygen-independent coproporphyrinogen III oxidase
MEMITLSTLQPEPEITEGLLSALDVSGPRYTSYPTADRFVDAFGEAQHRQALWSRSQRVGSVGGTLPLSVYIHIPFCESVCYYCACNKVVTRHHERGTAYLEALETEMSLQVGEFQSRPSVTQLHLGGGSPTFLSDVELTRLMASVREYFDVHPDAEVAMEVDPRTVDESRLAHFASLGFNRLSFGVQDFDADVQRAVHRVQDEGMVQRLVRAARGLGFKSINLDLIYGLPRQTPASVDATLHKVGALRPDRIALYAYAHLPERFKPQRRIDGSVLPSSADKIKMLSSAIRTLVTQGYSYVGMDHFALPSDELAVARRQGRLHRNFQGYTTQADNDLLGLGVSAISRVGPTYSQNHKSLEAYLDSLKQGHLPIERGLTLTRDDLVRRAVIMALMCQGRFDFESIELAHFIEVPSYFKNELAQLSRLADQGLVSLEPDAVQVTPLGRYFLRAVAMVFDRQLQHEHTQARFSRIV